MKFIFIREKKTKKQQPNKYIDIDLYVNSVIELFVLREYCLRESIYKTMRII